MTILLVTEDDTTGEAIEILAKKTFASKNKPPKILRRRISRGDIFKPEKLIASLKYCCQDDPTKIIICVDSECTDPKITERNLGPCKRSVKASSITAHFAIIERALESWLAADEEALRELLKSKKKLKIPGNLEKECHPESILNNVFRMHDRDFIKSRDDVKIANHANPKEIAKRCTSFRKFQQLLIS